MSTQSKAVKWQPNQRPHTFQTGRTAVIRRHVPFAFLMRSAARNGDEAAANLFMEIQANGAASDPVGMAGAIEVILREMWVAPRVVWDDAEVPDYGPDGPEVDENGWPDVVHVRDLEDAEVMETLDLVSGEVAEAETFRGDEPRDGTGGDGEVVGDAPKRPRRTTSGKR